jgi:hypothetical protein
MHLVFKNKFGDYKWDDKLETESLQAFADKFNKRTREMGAKRDLYYVESPRSITQLEWDGKLAGTWHPCDKDIHRLI